MLRYLSVPMAIALAATPVHAQSAAPSPLFGAWSVDVSKLPIPPEFRPQRVVITFSDAGALQWKTDVEIVDAAGRSTHQISVHDLNGTPVPITNGLEADIVSARSPAPGVLILALGKGGIPASTRIYTVQPDGVSMTETAVYFGEDGKPIMRTNYFTRVP